MLFYGDYIGMTISVIMCPSVNGLIIVWMIFSAPLKFVMVKHHHELECHL